MKILWIVHDILPKFIPFVSGKYTLGGSWISPLFYSLQKHTEAQLGIITPVVNGSNVKKIIDGISYYSIGIKKNDNIRKRMRYEVVQNYLWAINDFEPAIIHIHGTENNFGLLREYLSDTIPIVISIQGIISTYYDYLLMSFPEIKYYKSIKSRFFGGGISGMQNVWKKYCQVEKEIFRTNKYFIGRTLWDKAQVYTFNSDSRYFHGEELLRQEFSEHEWKMENCEKYSIFISSGENPIKGLHILLHAAGLLKAKYPTLKIYVPLLKIHKSSIRNKILGIEYANYTFELLKKYDLQSNLIYFPRLSAHDMALRYASSHVFVLPSFIDNSPNSLLEAMKIGVPTIVSDTGGISSMVSDGSSLVFPIGDYRLLAYYIDQVFQSNDLALTISKKAKLLADYIQNTNRVSNNYYKIYREIIDLDESSASLQG